MTPGDDHSGGQASEVSVLRGSRQDDVIVDVGVERGQRVEFVVLAATERRDVGFAQRLADINILPFFAILGDGALDQLIELIGFEYAGALKPAIAPVGPASSMRPS